MGQTLAVALAVRRLLTERVLRRLAQEDIDSIESEKARRYIGSLPLKPRIPPERIYPNANPEAIDLLQARCRSFDPSRIQPRLAPLSLA